MTLEEADSGTVNKNQPDKDKKGINLNSGSYATNCQSCVVAFEARMRGYSVIAAPRHNSVQDSVAKDIRLSWLTSKGHKPEYDYSSTTCIDSATFLTKLESIVKDGERYLLWYKVKMDDNTDHFHVVNLVNVCGTLTIIENQRGVNNLNGEKSNWYQGDKFKQYIKNYIDYSVPCFQPRLLRIDNKGFNLKYTNDLVEREV